MDRTGREDSGISPALSCEPVGSAGWILDRSPLRVRPAGPVAGYGADGWTASRDCYLYRPDGRGHGASVAGPAAQTARGGGRRPPLSSDESDTEDTSGVLGGALESKSNANADLSAANRGAL